MPAITLCTAVPQSLYIAVMRLFFIEQRSNREKRAVHFFEQAIIRPQLVRYSKGGPEGRREKFQLYNKVSK